MTAIHSTFTLERTFPVPPARVFAAWADPALKARWFAGGSAEHELDFRVGGRETARGTQPDGTVMTFDTTYRDVVDGERIVYTSGLYEGDALATVSLTTVTFEGTDGGTRLTLVEQGAYLDGREKPEWREQGTSDQLDALGGVLAAE